jgi:assimilatory nitrate reductase catalytic subunit
MEGGAGSAGAAPAAADASAGLRETRTTCCYCGVGCGVVVQARGERICGVRGDAQHPANFGRLCSKGNTLHQSVTAAVTEQARLLRPMLRTQRAAAPQPIGWDAALDLAAARLHGIVQQHGADALGFYVSGQLLTEDYYAFNKLAKGLLQTNNIDTNSRLCMSSAVAGYKLTLGADAPPPCYEDIGLASTLFLVGANMAFAHPVLFRRIEDAKRANPQLRIIVADPRRTDTAELADLYLPLAPGSDVALFHGMLHVLLWDGLLDAAFIAAHTNGFDALKERVREFTPREAARICGIPELDLVRAAHWFGQKREPGTAVAGGTLSLYCQGLNQSADGTSKNAALINLHLATGQIGKPGAGPLSLTGQPNAMGGREVGAMANLLSGHRSLASDADRAEVARLWQLDSVPERPGLAAVELFEAAAEGRIKALWIACTNPAQSMPDLALVRRGLERAEFVVVQECFAHTATARFADLLLPAASWGEKDGTVTNSERRISRVRAAVVPPGEARPDWRIVVDLAHRLEQGLRPGLPTLFPYRTAEDIWNEHRETTRGRDLDITGLSYSRLDAEGPQQWPYPEGGAGCARLYADGIFPTADGRARFADMPFKPVAEARDARYPFSLLTGRLRDQWHGMSRTGTIGQLFGHVPEPALDMHPRDMERLGLAEGDLVHVTSRRGSIVVPVAASATLSRTQVFLPMHWGEEYLGGRARAGTTGAGVNALTLPRVCPTSGQPELKHAAVKVLRAEMPWRVLAMAWLPAASILQVREQLRGLMDEFPFAVCVPFGTERQGVMFRSAGIEPAPVAILEAIDQLLGLAGDDTLRYIDRRHGQRRSMRLAGPAGERRLEGFMLAGDTASAPWIRELLVRQAPADAFGRLLLKPGATPPAAAPAPSRNVCSCFGVTEVQIRDALSSSAGSDEERLVCLQGKLQCGTNCGSCLPELKRLVRAPAVKS